MYIWKKVILRASLLTSFSFFLKKNSFRQNNHFSKATRFGLVVRNLGSMLEVLGSILSSIVNRKKSLFKILIDLLRNKYPKKIKILQIKLIIFIIINKQNNIFFVYSLVLRLRLTHTIDIKKWIEFGVLISIL
jgi:hypothetical protein